MWENTIDINEVREIRSRTTIYLGVGAINKINDIVKELSNKNIKKILVVTDENSYKISGAWDYVEKAFKENSIIYEIYNLVTPNPTVDQIDAATKMGLNFSAQAILAIGGGSPIDTGKSAAILIKYPENNARELFEGEFIPTSAVPIIVINLTHGTGSEVDRFAVATIPEKAFKPALTCESIYPLYSIDDPALMLTLPPDQTIYVSLDAVHHVIEASTTKLTSPFSIMIAKETVRLVNKYLPIVIKNPKDLRARYYLLYASMIAGICFDNTLVHITHALEHPLSGMNPKLSHGLGLSILLPAILKQIYPVNPEILSDVLSPIMAELKGTPDEAEKVAVEIEKWLFSFGVTEKLNDVGFSENDIDNLVNLAETVPSLSLMLSIAPVKLDNNALKTIYRESLTAYSKLT